ncbi:MFS general substrate transporter [Schizophyllum commune Loenen D]|nr:MFS general substrate transporter [Schizophyllum commune Loenen D]
MSIIRDSTLGHILYYGSRRHCLSHPEDREDFNVPQRYTDEKGRTDGGQRPRLTEANLSSSDCTPRASDEETVVGDPMNSRATSEVQKSEKGVSPLVSPAGSSPELDGDPNLVTWYGPDDPANPMNWSFAKKSFVTLQLCVLTFSVYVGSSIYSPGIQDFAQAFGTNLPVATLGMTLFVFGYGIGPMFLSPLTEIPQIGRNPPYMISLFIFVVLQVPTALATNVPGFLVLRFLAGFWGSPPQATVGASISDMFAPKTRAYAMGLWGAFSVCGPVLGPIIGGFAAHALGWRWSIWPLLFLTGATWIGLFVLLPETSPNNILYRRKERLRRRTGNDMLYTEGELASQALSTSLQMTFVRPFHLMLTEPIVLSLNVYIALIYALLYVWFEAFPLVFTNIYGFNLGMEGLAFLGIFSGVCVTYPFYCIYAKWYLEPLYEPDAHGNTRVTPEARLPPALIGCWAIPACLFWFGWTSTASIHWIVPIIGSSFFSVGTFCLFQSVVNYLVPSSPPIPKPDSYPGYAASVLAGNNFFRAIVGGAFPLFARAMFENLQKKNGSAAFPVSCGCTLLGCLSLIMVPLPYVFFRYGRRIRHISKYALHDD